MSALENAVRTAYRLHREAGRTIEINMSGGGIWVCVRDAKGYVIGKGESAWTESRDGAVEMVDALTQALAEQQIASSARRGAV